MLRNFKQLGGMCENIAGFLHVHLRRMFVPSRAFSIIETTLRGSTHAQGNAARFRRGRERQAITMMAAVESRIFACSSLLGRVLYTNCFPQFPCQLPCHFPSDSPVVITTGVD